jgi:two-component system, chemotaxis family, sensor histidine kinase and response regulator WspE
MSSGDLSQFSMLDLFREEARNQMQDLTAGLLALERDPHAADRLEACMRAAHSTKGAARIIDLTPGVTVADAMEECFVAAQKGQITLRHSQIDVLLQGVDLLLAIAHTPETDLGARQPDVDAFLTALQRVLAEADANPAPESTAPGFGDALGEAAREPLAATDGPEGGDRMLRITASSLNRLLDLAGESLMEARRLKPFADGLLRLKRLQADTVRAFERLRGTLPAEATDERAKMALADTHDRIAACQQILLQRLADFDALDRRATSLADRLYSEALACRMRPLDDGVRWYARIVRDLGRALGKEIRLEIVGGTTSVDRDILEKLDMPLGHLLRNAVDHGIETPEERQAAGKPAEGVIRIEASHSAGLLQIIVADDGPGIDLDKLREAIVARNLTNDETARKLSDAELLEFLFLPGFTMKSAVTTLSGRGVGLDAVQTMVKQVRGIVRITSELGRGTQFHLQLPLTLSVVRTLLVDINGEPYAFPLAGILRAMKLPKERIELLEGRQHFTFEHRQVGLVTAHQIFEGGQPSFDGDEISIVVVGDQHTAYGLVVDRFQGEYDLVVKPLDPRLGKITGISAAALREDGSPVLIVDIEDMIRSVEKMTSSGRLSTVRSGVADTGRARRKRVLVVEDSLTVRELERKLLSQHGYEVEVAVDGMDGWNAVRASPFDLIVTDVDMPRMDGIELVTLIKGDPNLRARPVMIVSYKDREEDRRRGLHAGADYYLAKGSFHDETLVQAVADLIGAAEA